MRKLERWGERHKAIVVGKGVARDEVRVMGGLVGHSKDVGFCSERDVI